MSEKLPQPKIDLRTLHMVEVEAITLIAAEKVILSDNWKKHIEEKYGELAKHLNHVFLRVKRDGETYVYIPGNKVFGAFKDALYRRLVEEGRVQEAQQIKHEFTWREGEIIGIYFPETCVGVKVRLGKETGKGRVVVPVEVIQAPCRGYMCWVGTLPPIFQQIEVIRVGAWEKHGYGFIRIYWNTKKVIGKLY